MYDVFKNPFFLILIDSIIQYNEYITNTPYGYRVKLSLLDKMDVYCLFRIMYNESASMWMSLGLRPGINLKTSNKFLSFVNRLPNDLINHVASFIPPVNYLTHIVSLGHFNDPSLSLKYIDWGGDMFLPYGWDSSSYMLEYTLNSSFTQRPFRNTRVRRRFSPYPEPPSGEAINVSRIRALTEDV
jgi:hypothetical protein